MNFVAINVYEIHKSLRNTLNRLSLCKYDPYHYYPCAVNTTLLTKTTAAQNEDVLSYHRVRGLYFQAVVFVATVTS